MTDDSDLKWLRKKARDERDAVFVYWVCRGADKAEAAERAGYSAGRSNDPAKQRKALQTSASGALKSNRIRTLVAEFQLHQLHGDKPGVATEKEVLQRLTEVMRTATDASTISAAKGLLEHHKKSGRQSVTKEAVMHQLVGTVGREDARTGLKLLRFGHLMNMVPELFADKPETDDIDARLSRLEREKNDGGIMQEREQPARPVAEPSGVGAGNSGVRGLPGDRREAAREVGGRHTPSGGPADGGGSSRARDGESDEERDAMRDADGKVLTVDELRVRQREIFGL